MGGSGYNHIRVSLGSSCPPSRSLDFHHVITQHETLTRDWHLDIELPSLQNCELINLCSHKLSSIRHLFYYSSTKQTEILIF